MGFFDFVQTGCKKALFLLSLCVYSAKVCLVVCCLISKNHMEFIRSFPIELSLKLDFQVVCIVVKDISVFEITCFSSR